MLGTIPDDLVGTNPKYPKIVDHKWLNVDKKTYDNYPSNNNPVRVIPELAQSWSTVQNTGINLIPDIKQVPVKMADAEEQEKAESVIATDIVRYAKKAMMQGLYGKTLAESLRTQFMPDHIKMAKDELAKLSEEQGLLGNVYVDFSAFNSDTEAEDFFKKSRNRLAKFAVVDDRSKFPYTLANLKKKIVATMDYTPEVLESYKDHLVAAGKIASDSVVDSKEVLRAAFMLREEAPKEPVKKEASIPSLNINEAVSKLNEGDAERREAEDRALEVLHFAKAKPILRYAQEQMLNGKIGEALKETLRTKFSLQDLAEAGNYLKIIASNQGLQGTVFFDMNLFNSCEEGAKIVKASKSPVSYVKEMAACESCTNNVEDRCGLCNCNILKRSGSIDAKIASSYIDDLVFTGKVGTQRGTELKAMAETEPLKALKTAFLTKPESVERTGGVEGYMYAMNNQHSTDSREFHKRATTTALNKGISLDKIREKLGTLMAGPEADGLLKEVLSSSGPISADVISDCSKKKYGLGRDTKIAKTSKCDTCVFSSNLMCAKQGAKFVNIPVNLKPTEEALKDQQEFVDIFSGSTQQDIEVGAPFKTGSIEINNEFSRDGIDSVLGS